VPTEYPAQTVSLQLPQVALFCEGAGARKGMSALAQPGDVAVEAAGVMNAAAPAAGSAVATGGTVAPARDASSNSETNVNRVDRQVIGSPFS
jgi:hypothetical protein